jgi:RNA polymerase sigma factor (sigma-70 family)
MNSAQDSSTSGVTPADFEAGVLDFAGRLRSFVRKRIANPQDAEDVAQDVFLKVFRSRASLRNPDKLEAWIYQSARSSIIDYYRRRRPQEELDESRPQDIETINEAGANLVLSVRRFIQTLSEEYRRPLEMAEFEDKSVAEISAALKISPSATKSRLTRARAQLRDRFMKCCRFEYDSFGKVIDYKGRHACACEETPHCVPEAPHQGSAKTRILLPPLNYALATENDAPAILSLLKLSGLPTEDLNADKLLNFVIAKSGTHLLACAGIEPFGRLGLLRSVAVLPELRGLRLGSDMVERGEALACQLELREIYLLTIGAASFFSAHGYAAVPRSTVPPSIAASSEFASVCPASSKLMRKSLT